MSSSFPRCECEEHGVAMAGITDHRWTEVSPHWCCVVASTNPSFYTGVLIPHKHGGRRAPLCCKLREPHALSPASGGRVGTEPRPGPWEAPPGLGVGDTQTPLLVEPVGLGGLVEEGSEERVVMPQGEGTLRPLGLWLCPGAPLPAPVCSQPESRFLLAHEHWSPMLCSRRWNQFASQDPAWFSYRCWFFLPFTFPPYSSLVF